MCTFSDDFAAVKEVGRGKSSLLEMILAVFTDALQETTCS